MKGTIMRIQDIFEHDIDRNINGVVKVGDVDEALVAQELEEYVVAKELQSHFATFFNNYEKSIDRPTGKMGVWISGFFGSGKSHFLKMLSYILANPEVRGKHAVDYFERKMADPLVYAQMKRASSIPTETILFNVDSKGGKWKEGDTTETAILRSFQRVFYENMGFYGEDLKLARLEMFIDSKGRMDEFRATFEDVSGMEWVENRAGWAFYEDDVIETLTRTLGMSRDAAQHWFDGSESDVVSSETFAKEVAAYIQKKADELGQFRLLFMADEIGQFIGSNSSLMLNMQTMVEDLGTYCGDKVWICVTSQQAIDSVTDIIGMDFSKIQGRFDTRLSLSSSDVDEIIKERVLTKTPEADAALHAEYANQATVLKNLFTFDDATSDLFGYTSAKDFAESYPFVGYQFRVLPDVFTKIREHGFSGKHMSSGERSMISAFQESAQKVEDEGTGILVPFWRFYDTIETSLDYGIRQVISRCQDAADEGHGLFEQDVHVIKALYLIRYLAGDITPNVNNIANLMIDSMDVDKIALRKEVQASLERLVRENKAARNGDKYNFLTSEEQDVADEISKVEIEASDVTDKIKRLLFDGLYTATKHRVGQNDFPFDRYVDESVHGKDQGGMKLNVITYAHEWSRLADAEFALKSPGQALIGLDEGDYYELLEMSTKVEKYIRTNSQSEWSASKRDIVRRKREEASENEKLAKKALEEAVAKGRVAVNGRILNVGSQKAAKKIDAALDELVGRIYTKADCVDASVDTDSDVIKVYLGEALNQPTTDGNLPNWRAMDEVMHYLEAQAWSHQSTNMGDLQRKYQKAPYGWREIDIAAVIARMLYDQKVALSVGGKQLDAGEVHMIIRALRTDADKASIKKREAIDAGMLASVQRLMKDFTGSSQVPADEDNLVAYVRSKLRETADECQDMLARHYSRGDYPGKDVVAYGKKLIDNILSSENDPLLLCTSLANRTAQDDLLDLSEDLEKVRGFFNSQMRLYDESTKLMGSLATEGIYLEGSMDAQDAIERIQRILGMNEPYNNIKDLAPLNKKLEGELRNAANVKRDNLLCGIDDALAEIVAYAEGEAGEHPEDVATIVQDVRMAADAKQSQARSTALCSQLDAQTAQLSTWKDQQYTKIDEAIARANTEREKAKKGPASIPAADEPKPKPAPKPKVLHRSRVCPTKTMRTEDEIYEYVDNLRDILLDALRENGAVRLGD